MTLNYWHYRKISFSIVVLVVVLSAALLLKPYIPRGGGGAGLGNGEILLPAPRLKGDMSVEEAIARRRSVRNYRREPLTLSELSQLLWAAQGITHENKRSAPSAGATYPMEVFVFVGSVEGVEPGIYRYDPARHSLQTVRLGDLRGELQKAALNQEWVGKAAADIVLVAFYGRTTGYYGSRGRMYVHMEAGHIGQNIYLQATALGLGTVSVGAFDESRVAEIIGTEGVPLYIFPVGRS
jgi:SagB-type dehydrogenase family enzyme